MEIQGWSVLVLVGNVLNYNSIATVTAICYKRLWDIYEHSLYDIA